MPLTLIKPDLRYAADYAAALTRGWSPSEIRPEIAAEQLKQIDADPVKFIASLDDPHALAGPVPLPDGTSVPRLPSFWRWLWDGEFCGTIQFRWQPGTPDLPPYCLGHIGFAVVPWKRNKGYATRGLALLLIEAREQKFPYVELTADPGNIASQKVIGANGGQLVERFRKTQAYGGRESLRFRIYF
jgi:predicted acetyltransferase